MSAYADTFERKEVKYRLVAGQLHAIGSALEGRMELDMYGRSRVSSIYFDTPDHSIVCRSLEKPLYKEKLRLRFYGAPAEDGCVFLELKKKFKGIVYKRRVACSFGAARDFLSGAPYPQACRAHPLPDELAAAESVSPHSLQIVDEIDAFIERHQPLEPSMLIVCDRMAFAPVGSPAAGGPGASDFPAAPAPARSDAPTGQDDLRITFDFDISYRDLSSSASALGPFYAPAFRDMPLIREGEAVMEVKSAGSFPLWLVHALDDCRAYPTSFSKYGEAYKRCVALKQAGTALVHQQGAQGLRREAGEEVHRA